MKKTYSLLFCILLAVSASLSLHAAPVTPDQAMDIAKKIFSAQSVRKSGSSSLKLIWDGEEVATKATQPAFYVIARDGGGFVIVAGDDNVTPILAISDRGEFKVEDMPENVKWWMERMKAYVRATTGQTPEVGEAWAAFTTTKAGPIPSGVTVTNEILTPEWGQGAVYREHNIYNSKCPVVGGTNTLTGCVATAISEVMTTLSGIDLYTSAMPTSGSGTIEPYSLPSDYDPAVYTTAATEGHPYVLGANYDWANLRTLKDTATIKRTVERGSVADLALIENMNQLMADVGAVMHAYYSIDDTGAYTEQTPDSIAKYFGFNKAAYYDKAANYSAHQWREKLKEQLAVRPIVYRGRTSDDKSGHAFVFDGYGTYQGEDVFHVNFGWNGSCNGYYVETNLDTPEKPEGPGLNFSWKCGAVFDFYPAPNSTVPIKLEAAYGNEVFPGVIAKLVSPGSYALYGFISNTGRVAYDGKVKFAVRKKNGSIQDIEGAMTSFSLNVNATHSVGISDGEYAVLFPITGISFGDQVVCYYEDLTKEDSDASAWKLLPGPIATAISAWPLTPAAFIKTESSYSLNDWFVFELMNNNYIYPKTTWTITDPDGQTTTYQQSDKEFQLTKTGKYKIQAATAQTAGTVIENLVTIINVGSGNSQ